MKMAVIATVVATILSGCVAPPQTTSRGSVASSYRPTAQPVTYRSTRQTVNYRPTTDRQWAQWLGSLSACGIITDREDFATGLMGLVVVANPGTRFDRYPLLSYSEQRVDALTTAYVQNPRRVTRECNTMFNDAARVLSAYY